MQARLILYDILETKIYNFAGLSDEDKFIALMTISDQHVLKYINTGWHIRKQLLYQPR